MSVFRNLILKIFGEPITKYDDLLGKMTYAGGYYECTVYFKPIKKYIEVGIGGDDGGPSSEAKLFYKEIETNYDKILRLIMPRVIEELAEWNPSIEICNFKDEFEPNYMFIPSGSSTGKDWEIAFNTIHDSHSITVVIADYTVKLVKLDG